MLLLNEDELNLLNKEDLIKLLKQKELDNKNEQEISLINSLLSLPDLSTIQELRDILKNNLNTDLSDLLMENEGYSNQDLIEEKEEELKKSKEEMQETLNMLSHKIFENFVDSMDKISKCKKENYPSFDKFIEWEYFCQENKDVISMTSYVSVLADILNEDNKQDFYQHVMHDRYLMSKSEMISFMLKSPGYMKMFLDNIISDNDIEKNMKEATINSIAKWHYIRGELEPTMMSLLIERSTLKTNDINQNILLSAFVQKIKNSRHDKPRKDDKNRTFPDDVNKIMSFIFKGLQNKNLLNEEWLENDKNYKPFYEDKEKYYVENNPFYIKNEEMQKYKQAAENGVLCYQHIVDMVRHDVKLHQVMVVNREKYFLHKELFPQDKKEPVKQQKRL